MRVHSLATITIAGCIASASIGSLATSGALGGETDSMDLEELGTAARNKYISSLRERKSMSGSDFALIALVVDFRSKYPGHTDDERMLERSVLTIDSDDPLIPETKRDREAVISVSPSPVFYSEYQHGSPQFRIAQYVVDKRSLAIKRWRFYGDKSPWRVQPPKPGSKN